MSDVLERGHSSRANPAAGRSAPGRERARHRCDQREDRHRDRLARLIRVMRISSSLGGGRPRTPSRSPPAASPWAGTVARFLRVAATGRGWRLTREGADRQPILGPRVPDVLGTPAGDDRVQLTALVEHGREAPPTVRRTPRSGLLLRELLGPIRLEPVPVDVGRPCYRAVTSIDALALIETPPEGRSEGGSNSLRRWRRRESNPRPRSRNERLLQA